MFPNDTTVEDLLAQPADAVLAMVREQESKIDGSRPWHELAEGATSKATSGADAEALTWATAAVILLDRLGERGDGRRTREKSVNAAMELRAAMLNAHGPQATHPLLDPMILEAWFFRGLELRYEKAMRMLDNEGELTAEQFQSLKRLKDRIRILRSLEKQQWYQRGDELEMWYQLATPE
jgi:hypothetical protein